MHGQLSCKAGLHAHKDGSKQVSKASVGEAEVTGHQKGAHGRRVGGWREGVGDGSRVRIKG